MTNPSSGLSQPVRRVSHRPPLRERASPASPNSAASFPNCPNQCGESSRIVPTSAASNTPTAAQGTSSHSFPNQCGEFPGFPEQCGELSIGLPHPVRRVPPDRHAGSELLWLSRTVQPMRRVVPRPPSNAASFSGFPELPKPMRRVIPPGLPHPVRRVVPRPPSTAASPSDRAQGTSSHDFPELSNQCGELFPESHAVR